MEALFYLIFFWLSICLIVASFGSSRQIGFWIPFILSIFFTPLLGGLLILLSPKKSSADYLHPEAKKRRDKARQEYGLGDISEAVTIAESALTIQPIYPQLCFEIACYYSLLENKDRAFYFLEKAVEQGWNQFDIIQSDPDLNYLRTQKEFKEFTLAGYKAKTSKFGTSDKYESLEKLGKLKEQGLISDEEFLSEKKKLLNS